MKISLDQLESWVHLKDIDGGEYFWYCDNLYLKPELSLEENQFPKIHGRTIVLYLDDDSLVLLSDESKVVVEDRILKISLKG